MQCMESSSYRKHALMPSELDVGIQVLALGLANWKGWPLWKRQSLSWPQQAPTEPPQGRAEMRPSAKTELPLGKCMENRGKQ